MYPSVQQALVSALGGVVNTLIGFVPRLIVAIIVLLSGIIVGNWLKSLIKSLLNAMNFASIAKGSALEKFLTKAEIKVKVEEILGEAVRLIIIYIFLIAAVNTLGLTTVSQFLSTILNYTPKIISAIFILVLGVIAAGFVESVVKGALVGFDVATGRLMGKISSYALVIFSALVAIGELGIAESFINTLFIGFIATLSLGMGLAFGLGAKDLVAQMLADWYRKVKREIKPDRKS